MSVFKRSLLCAALLTATVAFAQNTDPKPQPVLDVNVHAMDGNFPGLGPMCPNTSKFIASDPKGKEEPFGWVKENCTMPNYPCRSTKSKRPFTAWTGKYLLFSSMPAPVPERSP